MAEQFALDGLDLAEISVHAPRSHQHATDPLNSEAASDQGPMAEAPSIKFRIHIQVTAGTLLPVALSSGEL